MLSPQQIQLIKSSAPNSSSGMSASSGMPMTPEQAKSSFSPSNSVKGQENKSGNYLANPIGTGAPNYFKDVGEQVSAGAKTFMQGLTENPGGGPVANLEGALKAGAGAAQVLTSPLVPITKPIGDAVNAVSDKISDIPAVQKFANTDAGKTTERVAGDVANASAIAGTVAGIGEGIPKVTGAIRDIASDIKTGMTPKVPEPIDTLARETGQVTPDNARSSAWKDIQPKQTPTTKLAYAKQGNTTAQGAFTKGDITPSSADAKLLNDYEQLYQDGTVKDSMTPNEKQTAVQQRAQQLHGQQKDFLATHDKAVSLSDSKGKAGLFDQLDSTAKKSSMPFSKDASAKGAYDSVVDTFKSLLKTGKSAGTVEGASTLSKIDEALTSLDSEMEKFGAWGKTKTGEITDTAMARQQAIRDIHTQVRDYIASQLPKNSPWTSIRSQESNMYQISDRLAQRVADTIGSSKVGQTIKNSPMIKAGIKAAGLGAGIHLIP